MWLLDANVPIALREILAEFSIHVETAEYRGWKLLQNGELVEAAYSAGFQCIVTQDEDFRKLASRAAWGKSPIEPIPGQVIEWP